MDLGISERVAPLLKKVKSFIESNVIPLDINLRIVSGIFSIFLHALLAIK